MVYSAPGWLAQRTQFDLNTSPQPPRKEVWILECVGQRVPKWPALSWVSNGLPWVERLTHCPWSYVLLHFPTGGEVLRGTLKGGGELREARIRILCFPLASALSLPYHCNKPWPWAINKSELCNKSWHNYMLSPMSPSVGSLNARLVLEAPDPTSLVTGPTVWLHIYFQPHPISLIWIPCYLDILCCFLDSG